MGLMVREAESLLRAHYEEIAWRKDKIKLNPDWNHYAALELAGRLVGFSLRKGGHLVGYSVFFLGPHPHYKDTTIALNDVIFVIPEMRGGAGGLLITTAEAELKALGVHVVSYHIKKCLDWGPLAERFGYEAVETNHWKYVGD
ncbi:MAG: hypothetical protein SFV24_19085 [Gemmatimonadales bacterium]|nr:hypothetical protein [Gemmatimonadales bacterium]